MAGTLSNSALCEDRRRVPCQERMQGISPKRHAGCSRCVPLGKQGLPRQEAAADAF